MSGSFQFVVPQGASRVRAIAVGGGGGGTNGHQPGGGGGYVNCSIVSVTSGQSINVTVGAGGTGAAYQTADLIFANYSSGGASAFGTYVVANGGSSCQTNGGHPNGGCPGGTGSGANCWYWCPSPTVGGTGGTGGNDGMSTPGTNPSNMGHGGQGMGNTTYSACLQFAKLHQLTAGAGGPGGQPIWGSNSAGGGGGGVLIDGNGPAAQNGRQSAALLLYTYRMLLNIY